MTNKENNVKEYLITIFISLLIVLISVYCAEFDMLFKTEQDVLEYKLNVNTLAEFLSIKQLETLLAQNPTNYQLNLRLARTYDKLGNYKKANTYYKNALHYSGRSNLCVYYYALFCTKEGLYNYATTLAEELDGNNTKIYKYKSKIYDAIGDKLMEDKNYSGAISSYQIVLKYMNSDKKNKKDIQKIKLKYSKAYLRQADEDIKNHDADSAISNLKSSINMQNSATANYKLGLIFQSIDSYEAEKYMTKAVNTDIYIVNPYIYVSLLNNLINISKKYERDNLYNYYSLKLNRYKRLIEKEYLFKDDIEISNAHVETSKKIFSKEKKRYVVFDLKNNSKYKIEQLYTMLEVFVNSTKYKTEKKVVKLSSTLNSYETKEKIKIELPQNIDYAEYKNKNTIVVKFFARKSTKAPWIISKIDIINF